jgi:Flp pilus assembly protein TadG
VKVLFVPFAIAAFVLFLLVLGAIGLGVSMAVLAALGRVWRFVSGADRRGRRAAERQQS